MKNTLLFAIISSLAMTLPLNLLSDYFRKASPVGIQLVKSKDIPLNYRYDSVKLVSTFRFPNDNSLNAAYARIVFPIFKNNNLDDVIKKAVLSPFKTKYKFKSELAATHPALSDMDAINTQAADYPELAINFISRFEAQAASPYLQSYWYADISVKVLIDKADYISILCKKDYFTGGAHDLYDHNYLNYDIHNHRLFTWQSQLKAEKLAQFKNLAEHIFRKNEGLTPTQKLDGYFFENEKFNLPDNFTITSKGLMFAYDYYEIKPFAAKTTELLIPFSDFESLILSNSILYHQLHKN